MAIDNPMFPNLSDTEKLVVLLNTSNMFILTQPLLSFTIFKLN